jgi:type IV pilus assembly protein PilM
MHPLALNFKNKLQKEKLSLGLDIGTAKVKSVKLKFSKESVELCGFDTVPSLKEIVPLLEIKKVNISVSGPSVIIRYVSFPMMKASELKQALKFEAQKHIPFPIAEVNLDGYILKQDLPDNKMLVLVSAVKKEVVSQRLKIIEEAGLRVNVIDIDSLALINAFNLNYSQEKETKTKTVALLNIGASFSNLNILEGNSPRLSRDIHIAGNNFTQRISDMLGIDFKSAENLKLNPDKEKLPQVSSALEPVLTNLATEIRTSFDYYESQNASSVVKIFLSGAGSKFSGLKDMLANLLDIEVEYWDPLKKINIAKNLDAARLKASADQLGVAVGLALRQ